MIADNDIVKNEEGVEMMLRLHFYHLLDSCYEYCAFYLSSPTRTVFRRPIQFIISFYETGKRFVCSCFPDISIGWEIFVQ